MFVTGGNLSRAFEIMLIYYLYFFIWFIYILNSGLPAQTPDLRAHVLIIVFLSKTRFELTYLILGVEVDQGSDSS